MTKRAITSEPLLHWTEVLTGLEQARVEQARETIASWGLPHVDSEFLDDTIDSAVGATLLIDSIDKLVEHGVGVERLLKKLRQEPSVWSTWAEFRAADIMVRWSGDESEVQLEEGRSQGAHADFRVVLPDDPVAASVEVKAVGLSDEEVAFCKRMAPSLRRLEPPIGLVHIHAPIDAKPPRISREQRRAGERESRKRVKSVSMYPPGLRGATIVGHGSEDRYATRVARRVEQAVRQLPEGDECWVAFLWSNGAPVKAVAPAIRWSEIPRHVSGIMLLGAGVAFPHRQIHVFALPITRDTPLDTGRQLQTLDETEGMAEFASLVLDRFERSSGVRATLLHGGHQEIVRRDGGKRIVPFNLLLDADPVDFDRNAQHDWRDMRRP
jgi:hypothetical protein